MNIKFIQARKIQIVIFASILALIAMSAKSAAATDLTVEGIRRTEMVAIAERYVNYMWTATTANKWNINDGLHTNDRTDTPYVGWCDDPWGCWEVGVEQTGVPYFWGGSTAVEDDPNDGIPDLHLYPQDFYDAKQPDGTYKAIGYFGEKLDYGLPAGDVSTHTIDLGPTVDPEKRYKQKLGDAVNGVDCVGFIGQVWRQGERYGMSKTNGISRPIRFKDLRAGDVVLRYIQDGLDHVVLFKEFVNYDPANGEPVGKTRCDALILLVLDTNNAHVPVGMGVIIGSLGVAVIPTRYGGGFAENRKNYHHM